MHMLPSKGAFSLIPNPTLAESGAPVIDGTDVAVRPYPFPYVAAFTICNDCDSMSRETFEDWHAFVNGHAPTPNGDGLGLEIDDSFFVWSGDRKREPALHRHFPEQEDRVDSDWLGRMVELAQAGWLTTMHSMGNWRLDPSGVRNFKAHRDQARYALDRLGELGFKATVFVNHSESVSNIGGPWGWYQSADNPEHPFYCLDLLKQYGFRFFWIDSCVSFEKFGDYLRYETDDELTDAMARFSWAHWLRSRVGRNEIVATKLPEDPAERRRLLFSLFNRTLLDIEARDGTPIIAFKRYRGREQPIMSTFCTQATHASLDELEARGGSCVIYQHFGIIGPRGREKGLSRQHREFNGPPSFDIHARHRLQDIARRFHAGRLWVATTGRLLNYLWLRDRLQFSLQKSDHAWVLTLEGIKCPALGARKLAQADLNGLGFLVPADAPEIKVSIKGRMGEVEFQRRPDPAWPGRHAVFIPWRALEWPS